jgi:hypothetical protein
MAQTYSTEMAGMGSTPVVKPTSPGYGARLRRYRASITLASQAAADTIVLARIPAGSTFAYGIIVTDTSLGSTTISIGNATTAAKYRALATFTATDTPTLFGKAGAIVDGQTLAADEIVLATLAAATAPSSGNLIVDLYFSNW